MPPPVSQQPTAASGASQAADGRYKLAFESTDSLITLRSDTARGLKGHGSVLDGIFTFFGDKLEKWIDGTAKRKGQTPMALKDRLEIIGKNMMQEEIAHCGCCHRWTYPQYGDFGGLSKDERDLMHDLCESLARWVKYEFIMMLGYVG